jgi:hypothetical protein
VVPQDSTWATPCGGHAGQFNAVNAKGGDVELRSGWSPRDGYEPETVVAVKAPDQGGQECLHWRLDLEFTDLAALYDRDHSGVKRGFFRRTQGLRTQEVPR